MRRAIEFISLLLSLALSLLWLALPLSMTLTSSVPALPLLLLARPYPLNFNLPWTDGLAACVPPAVLWLLENHFATFLISNGTGPPGNIGL